MGRNLTVTSLASPLIHEARGNLPVLLSVPHSGRDYPDWLVEMAAGGLDTLAALEDPLVDRLVWRAIHRGAGAVIARAPRAAVDCNRGEYEIDPSVIDSRARGRITARARGGLGIVPGRTQQHGYLWRRPISANQLDERLAEAHRPYHEAIASQLARIVDRFGCALLLDCHSMPPPPEGIAPVVIGDGRGRTAASWVSREALAIVARNGFAAGLNDPFAGGYVIETHARPAHGIHALQIELDRNCYLDESLAAPGPGFDHASRLIEALAEGLGSALLDRHFATAAE
jgi:N-formylglutamate amidohydrolase